MPTVGGYDSTQRSDRVDVASRPTRGLPARPTGEVGDRLYPRGPPRDRRVLLWCAAAVVVGAGLATTVEPVVAQTEDPDSQLDAQCLASGTSGERDDVLATRVLHLSDPPSAFRVERNGPPVRRGLRFETDLDPAFLEQAEAANFLVTGTLYSADHGDLEGYVQVNASADGQDEIAATLCIDPTPEGLTKLPVGVYRARLKFADERVPEVVTEIEVLVGETSSRTRYWFMVASVSIALGAGAFALVELVGQRGAQGPGGEALRQTRRMRAGLSAGIAVAVVVVGVAFTQDRDFATWSLSMAGLWTFLGFAYGGLLLAIGAVISGAKQVRDLSDLVASQPTDPAPLPLPQAAPTSAGGIQALPPPPGRAPDLGQVPGPADAAPTIPPPPPPPPPPPGPGWEPVPAATSAAAGGPAMSPPPSPGRTAPDTGPRRRRNLPAPRRVRPRRAPVLIGAALGGIILAAMVASVGGRDDGDDSATPTTNRTDLPGDGGSGPDDTDGDGNSGGEPPTTDGGGAEPTTTVAGGQPDGPFTGLAGGSTDGDAAVARLRSAGFVVFDYDVCSDTVPSRGLLRQVRLTETGAEVVGLDGPTELAERVEAPSELDVLIASGSPC